jgi:hypothetical protein
VTSHGAALTPAAGNKCEVRCSWRVGVHLLQRVGTYRLSAALVERVANRVEITSSVNKVHS